MSDDQQPTVVIADDDKNNVLALDKVFQREGFRVITASGGAEALAAVRAGQVDVGRDHSRALAGEASTGGRPDPGGRTGHHRHLALEQTAHDRNPLDVD
jgi:hypothetical protein